RIPRKRPRGRMSRAHRPLSIDRHRDRTVPERIRTRREGTARLRDRQSYTELTMPYVTRESHGQITVLLGVDDERMLPSHNPSCATLYVKGSMSSEHSSESPPDCARGAEYLLQILAALLKLLRESGKDSTRCIQVHGPPRILPTVRRNRKLSLGL